MSTWFHLFPKKLPKARLGGALGRLGRVLGRLGDILGRLRMVLESSWAVFGRLVDVLGRLGKKLRCLGVQHVCPMAGAQGPPIRILYDFPDIIRI